MAIDFTALNNACVLYYSMDNADISGSTILDLTANNNDGTCNGMGTSCNTVTGKLNEAISFDGVDDYVSIPNSVYPSSGKMTIIQWINVNDASSTGDIIIGKGRPWKSIGTFVTNDNSGTLVWRADGSNPAGVSINYGEWYMVSLVVDDTSGEFSGYLNTNKEVSSTGFTTFRNDGDFEIGRNSQSDDKYFNGLVDETIIIYDALTQEDIEYFYNQGAPTVNQQYPFSPNVIYEIKGEVTLSGTATQGATLRLYDQTEGTYEGSTTTDVSGNYLFENLTDTNEYHVSVEYDDGTNKYNSKSKPYVTPTEQ